MPLIAPIVCMMMLFQSPDAAPLSDEIDRLDNVEGDAVGYAGGEGAFFRASRRLLDAGDRELLTRLTQDERPVVRALGLHVLARRDGEDALPVLAAAFADDAAITYFPGGCTGWTTTVSNFARELIRDANHLEMGGEARPLLPEAEQQALDLSLLARNDCAALHDALAGRLRRQLEQDLFALDFPALARVAPGVDRVEFVRGVGRVAPCAARSAFLRSCLTEPELEPAVRLAAASALARDPSGDAAAVLESARPALVAAAGPTVAAEIVRDFGAARAHTERMAPIRRARKAVELERLTVDVRRAWSESRPCALSDLESGLSKTLFRSDDGCRDALIGALETMARRTPAYSAPWNTWSDGPARLRFLIAHQRQREGLSRALDEESCRRIERALGDG